MHPVPDPVDPASVPSKRKPWRLRHPKTARAILYGGFLALGAAGLVVALRVREDARQQGLLTTLHGIEVTIRGTSPDLALRLIRDEVLGKEPSEDVRLRARLAEAATFDAALRFDEAEASYGALRREWPAGRPLGALVLPWANMRVRAGRATQGLELLDAPGATEGESEADVRSVREAATRPLAPFAQR